MARPDEEYVKLYVAFAPELLRRLKDEEPRVAATLMWLALSLEHGNVVHGTQAELADYAHVHVRSIRRYLLRLRALGLASYDARHKVLRMNPNMVFRGSEKERDAVAKRWAKAQRGHMEAVK